MGMIRNVIFHISKERKLGYGNHFCQLALNDYKRCLSKKLKCLSKMMLKKPVCTTL